MDHYLLISESDRAHCDRIETRENIFKINEGNFETIQFMGKLIARIVAAEDKLTKIISKEELREQQLQDLHIGPIM